MSERRKPLTRRFPGQPVLRCKVWAENRDSIEVDGPISPEAYRLLCALLPRLHPSKPQAAAMEACSDLLMGKRE